MKVIRFFQENLELLICEGQNVLSPCLLGQLLAKVRRVYNPLKRVTSEAKANEIPPIEVSEL